MSITELSRHLVYGQKGMVCSNSPLAASMRSGALDLLRNQGFREYFDLTDGSGRGAENLGP